jgi:hypothetical protein
MSGMPDMKIYLAGTPGIESRERERVAKDFKNQTAFLLGYSAGSVLNPFCI